MQHITNKIKSGFHYMHIRLKNLSDNEEGMGTIEIVIIIAVLIGLAFLFRTFAMEFFTELTAGIRNNNQIDDLFNSP